MHRRCPGVETRILAGDVEMAKKSKNWGLKTPGYTCNGKCFRLGVKQFYEIEWNPPPMPIYDTTLKSFRLNTYFKM